MRAELMEATGRWPGGHRFATLFIERLLSALWALADQAQEWYVHGIFIVGVIVSLFRALDLPANTLRGEAHLPNW
jgi:hypothetical protein